jgi:hypothetical protein
LETKLPSKKSLKEEIHFMQQISIHIQVMGDKLFFLADHSQPLGPGEPTNFYTFDLLLFQYAVKLIL